MRMQKYFGSPKACFLLLLCNAFCFFLLPQFPQCLFPSVFSSLGWKLNIFLWMILNHWGYFLVPCLHIHINLVQVGVAQNPDRRWTKSTLFPAALLIGQGRPVLLKMKGGTIVTVLNKEWLGTSRCFDLFVVKLMFTNVLSVIISWLQLFKILSNYPSSWYSFFF